MRDCMSASEVTPLRLAERRCWPALGDVGVRVVEAGHDEGAVQIDLLCGGRGAGEHGVVGAGDDDAIALDADGADALGRIAVVDGVETYAGENVAVVVDGVGHWGSVARGRRVARRGAGEEGAAGDDQGCRGLHDDEFSSFARWWV